MPPGVIYQTRCMVHHGHIGVPSILTFRRSFIAPTSLHLEGSVLCMYMSMHRKTILFLERLVHMKSTTLSLRRQVGRPRTNNVFVQVVLLCDTRQTMRHLLVCEVMESACSAQDLTMTKYIVCINFTGFSDHVGKKINQELMALRVSLVL